MRTKHRWTTEDENQINQYVKNSPTNIREALRKSAEKLEISFPAAENHYYKYLQKRKSNKLLLLLSPRKASTNYKVTRKGKNATKYQPEKTKKSKWRRILAILAE